MNKKIISSLKGIQEVNERDVSNYTDVFSDKFGIINGILQRTNFEKYGYYIFQSLSAKTKVLFNLSRESSSGGLGISKNPLNALHECIGEAIERYCIAYCNEENLILKRYSDLPKDKTLHNFSLYSENQYNKEYNSFANPRKEKIFWDKITAYSDDRKQYYWPASLIYLPFESGRLSAETTSTGVAAHPQKEKAIRNGIMELIERDALMINFLNRLDPPEIDICSINDSNKSLIKSLLRDKYKIKIYKLYSDINIPIFLGFIWKEKQSQIHYGIGASASLDSSTGIKNTLEECLFTYLYSQNILNLKPENKKDIDGLHQHFLYYQGKRFNNLLFKGSKNKYEKESHTFQDLLKQLKKLNLNIYYKELSTSDIKSTKVRVFRTIIPSLVDLNKSYNLRRLGAKRLKEVPKKLGFNGYKISNMPHPFP